MSTFEGNTIPIQKLINSLGNRIPSHQTEEYMKELAMEYDKRWQKNLYANHWDNSKFRKILRVHERILLTDKMKGIENKSDILSLEIVPLRTYLLLTCFDQLGITKSWMTFDNFLDSKKHKINIINILLNKFNIKPNIEIDTIKEVYSEYKKLYGVGNSFFNFINEILNESTRQYLLDSIRIIISNPVNLMLKKQPTDQDKLMFLYKTRNDYTHNCAMSGNINNPKENEPHWTYRESYYLNNWNYSIYTKIYFDEILKDVLLQGITEIIKNKKYKEK